MQKLVLANTCFKKRWGLTWTHIQNNRKRQIDFWILDLKFKHCMVDAAVCKKIDLGSDHRAVLLTLDLQGFELRKHRRRRPKANIVGWKPADTDSYCEMLDGK
eukprot:2830589-Karenia_brevis.AAC.1